MNDKKKTMSIIAVAVILGSLFISQPAYAADKGFGGNGFFSGFIEFISQKLGLDKNKVQSAMQEYKQQRKATITPRPTMSPQDRQAAEKKRLDVLVSQGKITGDQENAILSELEVIRAKYPQDPNATPEQRKTQIQNIQNEINTWTKGQGIDPTIIPMFGRGGFDGMSGKGFRGRGPKPTTTP